MIEFYEISNKFFCQEVADGDRVGQSKDLERGGAVSSNVGLGVQNEIYMLFLVVQKH